MTKNTIRATVFCHLSIFHGIKNLKNPTDHSKNDCKPLSEPLFKKWKRSWMVVSLGGNLKCFAKKRSSRPQTTFNLKLDLVSFKQGAQVTLQSISVDLY
ncbi:hypothetical protein DPMN_129317 [Dreissena polymorpha]|uniref:Uncharacterized protein n=1 Tax=Dreissena polymorpha TaxID=45954 RepID=A0A9D4H2H9_DREPO|nr:hypothetical protein DPMN_129317 [Dreissena polymorpha]